MISYIEIVGNREKILDYKKFVAQIRETIYESGRTEEEWNRPCSHGIIHTLIVALEGVKIVGMIVAGIYPANLIRPDQWEFGESRFRSCWIERLDVVSSYRRKGIATELLRRATLFFSKHCHYIPESSRKNIYVVSLHKAANFYFVNGFTIIGTPDHDNDEDFPSTYAIEVAQFMARPFPGNNSLDREEDWLKKATVGGFLVEEYATNKLQGAENFSLETYKRHVEWCSDGGSNHPMQVLGSFSDRYTVGELEIVRSKIQQAIIDVGFETRENMEPPQFYRKRLMKNLDYERIKKWVDDHFPEWWEE